jgi:integration host factor subunit beta
MTRSDLVTRLAERFRAADAARHRVRRQDHPRRDVRRAGARHRIEIRGFGSFSINRRPPRMGRNPRSGEQVLIPEKLVPHFKPGKALREGGGRPPMTDDDDGFRIDAVATEQPSRARPRFGAPLFSWVATLE